MYPACTYYYNVYDNGTLICSWGFTTKELAESKSRQLDEMVEREGIVVKTERRVEKAIAYKVGDMVIANWAEALLHYWSIGCKGHIEGVF